jgi:uncharacterized cupin superfamily protein
MAKKNAIHFGLTYIATGDDTGGKYFLSETTVPGGDYGPPLYFHANEDEGFYIHDGELILIVDNKEVKLRPGDFYNIKKGIKHTWKNTTSKNTKMTVIFSPPGIEKMFVELDRMLTGGQTDFNKTLVNIGRKYGTEFIIDQF